MSIGLVACCGQKLPQAAAAVELYRSPLFRKAAGYCARHYSRWFVLSALYGLVSPSAVIAPYDRTLKRMSRRARQEWGERVAG